VSSIRCMRATAFSLVEGHSRDVPNILNTQGSALEHQASSLSALTETATAASSVISLNQNGKGSCAPGHVLGTSLATPQPAAGLCRYQLWAAVATLTAAAQAASREHQLLRLCKCRRSLYNGSGSSPVPNVHPFHR
jgi:hypothetical protein